MNDDSREQWRIDAENEWKEERRKIKANRHEQKRRRRKKQHDGKEALSKEKAFIEMYRIAHETGHTMSAYPCEFCEFWHVGNIGKWLEVDRVRAEGHDKPKKRATKKPPITSTLGELFGEELQKLRSHLDEDSETPNPNFQEEE